MGSRQPKWTGPKTHVIVWVGVKSGNEFEMGGRSYRHKTHAEQALKDISADLEKYGGRGYVAPIRWVSDKYYTVLFDENRRKEICGQGK